MTTAGSPDRQRKGGTSGQGRVIVPKQASDPRWASEATLKMEYRQALRYVIVGASDPFRLFSTYEVVKEIAFRGLPTYPQLLDLAIDQAISDQLMLRRGIDIYAPIRQEI